MEEDKKPPINEEYIMSMVSDTDSGKGKVLPAGNVQVRKQPERETSRSKPEKTVESTDEISGDTAVSEDKPEIKEVRKRKNRQAPADYESQFIKKADLTVRSGKGVYIRSDYHNSINRIISVIGDNSISITDYLDNIITHHFELFEQEITDVFDRKYKPIINKNK